MACTRTLSLTLLFTIFLLHMSQALHLYRTLENLDIDNILDEVNQELSDENEMTTPFPFEITPTTANSLDSYAESLFEALVSSLGDAETAEPNDRQPELSLAGHQSSLRDIYKNSLIEYSHQSPGPIKASSRLFKHWRNYNRRTQNPHLYSNI